MGKILTRAFYHPGPVFCCQKIFFYQLFPTEKIDCAQPNGAKIFHAQVNIPNALPTSSKVNGPSQKHI